MGGGEEGDGVEEGVQLLELRGWMVGVGFGGGFFVCFLFFVLLFFVLLFFVFVFEVFSVVCCFVLWFCFWFLVFVFVFVFLIFFVFHV